MAQYQITLDDRIVQALTQHADGGIAAVLQQVLNQVLEAQLTDHLQAARHERTDERQGYRNGYRERRLTTRVGTLVLDVPRDRDGTFSPTLFDRYQRHEKALVTTLMEMVVQGVSTRKVRRITEELCGTEFSKSTISQLTQGLDATIRAWRTRRLDGTVYPFLLVDALGIRVRDGAMVQAVSGCVVTGINRDGYREILGFWVGDSESERTWRTVFQDLKNRGLTGVELVVSDDHRGLVKAIQAEFQGASWQRCQTHMMRNLMDVTPKAHQAALRAAVRAIFEAPDRAAAQVLWDQFQTQWQTKAPRAVGLLEEALDDVLAVLAYPEPLRQRLRTTNLVERLNQEIRRRERVIRIFPNRAAAERLIGAVLMDQHEAWISGNRYLDLTEYWAMRDKVAQSSPAASPTPETAA